MALKHVIEKKVKPITFQAIVFGEVNGEHVSSPIGTAFAVSKEGHLVTALHVYQGFQDLLKGNKNIKLLFGFAGPDIDTPQLKMRANFVLYGADLVSEDQSNDLALFRLKDKSLDDIEVNVGEGLPSSKAEVCVLEIDRPDNGERIAISGYPLSEPSLVTTSGIVASNWSLIDEDDSHSGRYVADITANPGNSGGPVYLEKSGKVIGVCVAGKLTSVLGGDGSPTSLSSASGLTLVTPSGAVADLVNSEA